MRRFVTPHVTLSLFSIVYVLVGAVVFQWLERDHLNQETRRQKEKIERKTDAYLDLLWNMTKNKSLTLSDMKRLSEDKWDEFVDSVYDSYSMRPKDFSSRDEDPTEWTFSTSLFFTATMLTSIGYGFIVPMTKAGRAVCVVYCMIGVPLTLLTVANIAKFISGTLFWLHMKFWQWRYSWKKRDRQDSEETDAMLAELDVEKELQRVRLVRFPAVIMFVVLISYGFLAAHMVQRSETSWSFEEALYFTFISILTIGFGDYRPNPNNWLFCLVLVVVGVVLGTMCMDTIGSFYLEEIHFLGRKMKTANPFYLIREAQMRRRRRHLASMLAQLARAFVFQNVERRVLDGAYMFARQPPDPPTEGVVISSSAYSVRMAWNPAFAVTPDVTYEIRYKIKHDEQATWRCVRNITSCNYEMMNLTSCSLYEFIIRAVNQFGCSKPVFLVQYTEPEMSPQHIVLDKMAANVVRLSWEEPFKRGHDVEFYVVYYTDDVKARLSHWRKTEVRQQQRSAVFSDLKYDWFYMFSVRAVFKHANLYSPLSRPLFVRTDKLEFNSRCIGHSTTVEIMESIAERAEILPVIRHKFLSFAV